MSNENTEITLDSIVEMTVDQEARLTKLSSREEYANGVSAKESTERTSLIFLKQANNMKILATDEFVNEDVDDNYENQAIRNWKAYLKYTK